MIAVSHPANRKELQRAIEKKDFKSHSGCGTRTKDYFRQG